jgi:hypothetical protein
VGGDRTREFDCRVGEIWTPRWERAALLGRRDMDDGYAAGWERAELLPRRERVRLLGRRGLVCWAGETWTTVALLG